MTNEFWVGLLIAICANVATLAAAWGGFTARLKSLEAKVDKHNCLVERMYCAEGELKAIKIQIEDLKGE